MAVVELEAEVLRTEKPENQLLIAWRRLRRHKLAVVSMGVILFLVLVTVLAPILAPYDPIRYMDPTNKNAGPSAQHLMGTDQIGRDVLSRLLYAGRISLSVAFVVVVLTEVSGALIGAVSGYFGGWIDALIQRTTDFMLTLPLLPLLLAVSAILRDVYIPGLPREWSSAVVVTIVLTVFGWMPACRQARAMVLSLREREFTEASRAMGMSDLRIILRHMLPNSLPPLIVDATLALGQVIVLESSLSFLGLGIQPPVATWGNMLYDYQQEMWAHPIQVFFPGLTIFLATLSFNYLGDGLRDALDPRLKL